MESDIKDHYNSDHLTQTVKAALIKAGKDLGALELKDLSPVDQLHTGGALSSIALLKKTGLSPGALVLDAGCGIGGSSRLMAKDFLCKVIGIDLADKFIECAAFLTRCTGLEGKVTFQQGSVLELPFENHFFDAILCQHVLMNIQNKSLAIKEFFRVLKPGGKLILHEITKGGNDDLVFPVPWADKASISFLEPWDITAGLLAKQGFEIEFQADETDAACLWWEKVRTINQTKPSPPGALSPILIFGSNATYFAGNMHGNFQNNSIRLIEAVLKKTYHNG